MADYKKLTPHILKWEGEWSNDLTDAGGATMRGVTMATYKAYCRRKGYPRPTIERLRSISREQWEDIFRSMYWDRWQGDKIKSQSVANMLVDWLWCSGKWGIEIPQRVLGVSTDGVVGEITLQALNDRDPRVLFERLKEERKKFVNRIVAARPSNSKFLRGWLNRINDVRWGD